MESHSNCVQRIAAGDESALEELISSRQAYIKAVLRRAGVCGNGGHTWDDLCQIVWVKVWKKAHTFMPGASESAWLSQLAKNVAIDHLRKQARKNRLAPSCEMVDSVGTHDDRSGEDAEFIISLIRKHGGAKTIQVAEQMLAGNSGCELMDEVGIRTQATLRWRVSLVRSILEESPEFSSVFVR